MEERVERLERAVQQLIQHVEDLDDRLSMIETRKEATRPLEEVRKDILAEREE